MALITILFGGTLSCLVRQGRTPRICPRGRVAGGSMRLITLCLIVLAAEMPETIAAAATDGGYPPLFTTEMNARVHCPNDVVVWLTVPSSIYRFRGAAIVRRHRRRRLRLQERRRPGRRPGNRNRSIGTGDPSDCPALAGKEKPRRELGAKAGLQWMIGGL